MKFISPDIIHRYLRKLGNEALDIEFNADYNKIKESKKAFIIWNPYGYLAYPKPDYIKKNKYYLECLANNKPTYIVERGALPNSIFIDKNGFLLDSSSYDESNWAKRLDKKKLQKVKDYIDCIKEDITSLEPQKSGRLNKEEFFNRLEIDKNKYKKIIFVPLQMHNDTVTLLWSDWIENTNRFNEMILKLSDQYKDVLFLVKNHPGEESEKHQLKTTTDNLKIVDEFHYKDCIKYSDKLITINSGIGLQAMMWNKPVCIVGEAFYQFDELNYKAKKISDVETWIELESHKFSENLMYCFIYYLRFEFYSFCSMRRLNAKSSEPTIFDSITYEDQNGKRTKVENMTKEEPIVDVLLEFINTIEEYSLMRLTCLDCLRYLKLKSNMKNLYIGMDLNDKNISKLTKRAYSYDPEKKIFIKKGITIHIEPLPKNTKVMSIYGEPVNVPIPVVEYLNKLYGSNWMQPLKPKVQGNDNQLKVAYTFNLHGWIFEFESLYYQRYSKLTVKPMLESKLRGTKDIDIAMIPSAWHYRDLTKDGTISHLKRNNIKIVSQYNSHITGEIEHKSEDADLVMVSSEKLYEDVKKRHKFHNMIFMPHFVDTDFFKPKFRFNGGILGWTGNFENIYKRPHLIEQLDYDVQLQKDYKKSLEEKNRQDNMPSFYNSIDILVITSKSEGTPMPLLEAMSCGKVVLSTDVGIASMVLHPYFIVKGINEKEILRNFNEKIKFLKANPEFVVKHGMENRRIALECFSWKNYVGALDKIYEALSNNDMRKVKLIAEKLVKRIKYRIKEIRSKGTTKV